MASIEISRVLYDSFAGTLEQRVADFAAAIEAHRFSVGEPAPVEAPLIETIVRAGGMAEVVVVEAPPPAPQPEPPVPAPVLISKLVVVERIGFAGKLRAARAALKVGQPDDALTDNELLLRERWEAATAIDPDDAQVRAFIASLDLDPDAILAA